MPGPPCWQRRGLPSSFAPAIRYQIRPPGTSTCPSTAAGPPMATAYTSVESEIEDRRRRLLHHSAHKIPSTAQASENHTMLLPLLNGSEISLTKNPLYRT